MYVSHFFSLSLAEKASLLNMSLTSHNDDGDDDDDDDGEIGEILQEID
tara:strand:- start:2685 stop:2828 length:144 start_codon:yes stop_codon:yes gene_type:complete